MCLSVWLWPLYVSLFVSSVGWGNRYKMEGGVSLCCPLHGSWFSAGSWAKIGYPTTSGILLLPDVTVLMTNCYCGYDDSGSHQFPKTLDPVTAEWPAYIWAMAAHKEADKLNLSTQTIPNSSAEALLSEAPKRSMSNSLEDPMTKPCFWINPAFSSTRHQPQLCQSPARHQPQVSLHDCLEVY